MKRERYGIFHLLPLSTGGAQIMFGASADPASWSLLSYHSDRATARREWTRIVAECKAVDAGLARRLDAAGFTGREE